MNTLRLVRTVIEVALALTALSLSAFCQDTEKPCDSCTELYIVHSAYCSPCLELKRLWLEDNDFRLAIQEAYAVKDVNVDNPLNVPHAQAVWSKMFPGKLQVPFFYAKRDGKIVANHVGFIATTNGVRDFMNDLGIEWPRVPKAKKSLEPKPDIEVPKAKLEEPKEAAPKPPVEKPVQETKPPVKEAIPSEQPKPVEGGEQAPSKKFPDFLPFDNEAEASGTQSGGSKAGSALGTIASLGVKGLALYFGLPVAGASLAGAAVGYLLKRKRTVVPPLQVLTNKFPSTANHYLTREVDVEGEAYKEALRRVVAANKNDFPFIVSIAQQIDHTATELMRGKEMATRTVAKPFLYNE